MFQGFRDFFAKPFGDDMDVTDWFLFVGVLMVAVVIWKMILSHLLAD